MTNGEVPKLNLVSKFSDDDDHPPDNKFIRIARFHWKTFIHEGDQPGCMRRERREEGTKETSARARERERERERERARDVASEVWENFVRLCCWRIWKEIGGDGRRFGRYCGVRCVGIYGEVCVAGASEV